MILSEGYLRISGTIRILPWKTTSCHSSAYLILQAIYYFRRMGSWSWCMDALNKIEFGNEYSLMSSRSWLIVMMRGERETLDRSWVSIVHFLLCIRWRIESLISRALFNVHMGKKQHCPRSLGRLIIRSTNWNFTKTSYSVDCHTAEAISSSWY